jgi:hypothetical protein
MGKRGGNISPATQFKPGQSGNPKGRVKALPQLDKLMIDLLGDPDDKSGLPRAQEILQALYKQALKGDVKAAEVLLNRGYGKPKENEGAPTEMIIRVQRNG